MRKRYAFTMMFPLALWCVGPLFGQNYPTKPIRIITSPAGGGNDFVARMLANGMSSGLGQPIVVENRPNLVMTEMVAKAQPDGYTLLFAGSTMVYAPLLQKVGYDPVKDFAHISIVDVSPNVVVVHPAVPARSIKELIALAKAKAGTLNYASGGSGATTHLAAELFRSMAGVNIVRVNYKGAGPALMGVLAGEAQVAIPAAASAVPYTKSGRLRGLAVTSLEPSVLLPGLPTVAASGLPGYEVIGFDSLVAPAGTPEAVIKRLNQEVARVVKQPDVSEKLQSVGSEPAPSTPDALRKKVQSELAKWGKLIKEANITAE